MEAFTSPAKKLELQAIFEREARRLIDGGADVIVPTGGIPMMLFGKEPDVNVDGAPIVNGVTVVIKAAEMAVKLKRLGISVASRIPQSGFALPSAQTLDEVLRHGMQRSQRESATPGRGCVTTPSRLGIWTSGSLFASSTAFFGTILASPRM